MDSHRPLAHLLLAATAISACAREPISTKCPNVIADELVITELRGHQSGFNPYGEWLEIYNASGREVDLAGLVISIIRAYDGRETRVVVRRSEVVAQPASHVVMGWSDADTAPGILDYNYRDDFASSFDDPGAMELVSCGVTIDRIGYRALPSRGTLAYDGDLTPDAAANDVADPDSASSSWCTDTVAESPEPAETDAGDLPDAGDAADTTTYPGTPGEGNRPCS